MSHLTATPYTPAYALEIHNISLQRGERVILHDVSLRVPFGATCAVVGHNGSGKSTLLRVIEGYEFPTSGAVRIFGETLGETELARLRERVRLVGAAGMSSSGGERLDFPPGMPLLKVVATGGRGHLVMYDDPTPCEKAAAETLLSDIGLNATTRWGTASAGERTRALLARARMPSEGAGHTLLLLDEPTANLDPGAREAVVRAMSKPAPGTTQIIVTHHVEELPADTSLALVLKDGLTVAVGDADITLSSWNLSSTFGVAMDIRKVDSLDGGRWTARVLAD